MVYGDIGTSPLYAIRECFLGPYAVAPTHDNVLGVLSLVAWSLILVISVKYLAFVLKADYDGEGGILALMELVWHRTTGAGRKWIMVVGLFGAALLYGDGAITPAISVLSAIEGLEVATPQFRPYVVPLTLAILLGLFLVQRLGTAGVGRLFGPVMLIWFASIGTVGAIGILDNPAVLAALDPRHGFEFFFDNGYRALMILGIVFLVVTGGEALYADLGHFGTRPIRLGWYVVVLPGLLLNYFGQGALILAEGTDVTHPFYELFPETLLYPAVGLATFATIIASQAIISGAFSLTFQGFQLGYLPRVQVIHTSKRQHGQIYVPAVNWLMLAATTSLVLGFRQSGNLAAAYGIAISATMLITTALFYLAMRRVFEWPLWVALPLTVVFLSFDVAYFSANALKFADGGWVPVLMAGLVYLVMSTWRRGQLTERRHLHNLRKPVPEFLAELGGGYYRRVPGQAVYLSRNEQGTPFPLLHNLEHNRALHRTVVLYTAKVLRQPRVPADKHLKIERLRDDITRVIAYHGYMETPKPARDLAQANETHDLGLDLERITYFLSGEDRLPVGATGMPKWRSWLYVFLARNATQASMYFDLPVKQVYQIGMRMRI